MTTIAFDEHDRDRFAKHIAEAANRGRPYPNWREAFGGEFIKQADHLLALGYRLVAAPLNDQQQVKP